MELLEQIKQAGIVGCGGAGFPTHVKLNCKVETLIVNGAECEPLLRTDRWLMRHKARQIVTAAALCGAHVGATRICIALKETYHQAIEALREAVAGLNNGIEIVLLKNFYPAGDEQILVLEVTGRTVPPAGIPLDVGCVVANVATMYAIYEAAQGISFTQKYLTVTGEVAAPVIVQAPLGTSFAECIAAAGGTHLKDYRILCGGPLMGKLYTREEAEVQAVTKTTSGLVILPENIPLVQQREISLKTTLRQARIACIQCSQCTDRCPRYLAGHPIKPHKIMRKLSYGGSISTLLEDTDVRQAQICSECGVCEVYACPMGLQPRQVNAWVKRELAGAGIRYQRRENEEWIPIPEREWRLSPSKRIAARLGVEDYYDFAIDTLAVVRPRRVYLSLKQHIGTPSLPVVNVGDKVSCGDLIARCPEKGLGTSLCASIDGVVTSVDDAITIERG